MMPVLLTLTDLLHTAEDVTVRIEKGDNQTSMIVETINSDVSRYFRICIKDMDQEEIPRYKLIIERMTN